MFLIILFFKYIEISTKGLVSHCLIIYYQNYISCNSGMVAVLCSRIEILDLLKGIGLIIIKGIDEIIRRIEKDLSVMTILILNRKRSKCTCITG